MDTKENIYPWKVIQISVSSGGPDAPDVIYALCADGTIWYYGSYKGGWERLPWIPKE